MAITEAAVGLLDFTQRQVDRVVPPESRQKAYSQTSAFAAARPLLFTFLLAQLTFSLIPILLFLSFALSALLVAAGAALLFTLFWTALALAVLVPTLCITAGIALCVWAWAVACFLACRWVVGVIQGMAPSGNENEDGCSPSPSSPAGGSPPSSWAKIEPGN
ncbi:hypothetical protein VTK56DRAFT_1328 [Thermocarpiscus australiensis]